MKSKIIEQEIYSLILSGEIVSPTGQLLPERELAERFQTSRTTIRKAIDSLCKQGVLIQHHGNGTYMKTINESKYFQSLYSVIRCAQNYVDLGCDPHISVLSKKIVPANETIASYLKLPCYTPVLCIKKLFRANRQIRNVSVSYLSIQHFPGIEHEDFRNPIIDILNSQYKACPQKTEHTIEAIHPSAEIANDLDIDIHTPIILFESLTTGVLDGLQVTMEYFKTYHRTDHLRFNYTQMWDGIY